MDKTAIRNAATVILLRDKTTNPRVLMGQRGAKAAFMPNKFVFPGGAVDPDDAQIPLASTMSNTCLTRLAEDADPALVPALQTAAIREVWEETGLILGAQSRWHTAPPEDWVDFAATGHVPSAAGFTFVFRAITPPGRPRRFDARFFLADAAHIQGDPDDFSRASEELSQLQWIPLEEVRSFNLPFITEVVLAEIAALANEETQPESVPFFKNDDEESLFLRLGRKSPLSQ
ncbi:NUDIX domain-containing protein [Pseudohalocynthiibacter aestuariivivens]|jgi:8-oxo-dGTP pyrophosphatase MutT (NUDIX family)|uniref:NUDIX domain-containing protein n=1 Tax=Pseudohalocynthiibacter aestuariivivens TaxID=1591409 RepID=A0ABV5JG97_9RHOB|nr:MULTISPECIES: NUDIX hydrolase [Pseudohalocynthiibacter]MBS9716991.1 NUDIX hydrolase [Pseudohalocynthiibacter aestuariivivens]MCK0101910.1 NUDIX hydrolase [Pseudohalocynthiibacter sp. F2068]